MYIPDVTHLAKKQEDMLTIMMDMGEVHLWTCVHRTVGSETTSTMPSG